MKSQIGRGWVAGAGGGALPEAAGVPSSSVAAAAGVAEPHRVTRAVDEPAVGDARAGGVAAARDANGLAAQGRLGRAPSVREGDLIGAAALRRAVSLDTGRAMVGAGRWCVGGRSRSAPAELELPAGGAVLAALVEADRQRLRAVLDAWAAQGGLEAAQEAVAANKMWLEQHAALTPERRQTAQFAFAYITYLALQRPGSTLELHDLVQLCERHASWGSNELKPFFALLESLVQQHQAGPRDFLHRAALVAAIYNALQEHVCPNWSKLFTLPALAERKELLLKAAKICLDFLVAEGRSLEAAVQDEAPAYAACLDDYAFHLTHAMHLTLGLLQPQPHFEAYGLFQKIIQTAPRDHFGVAHARDGQFFFLVTYQGLADIEATVSAPAQLLSWVTQRLRLGGQVSPAKNLSEMRQRLDFVWTAHSCEVQALLDSKLMRVAQGDMVVARARRVVDMLAAYTTAVGQISAWLKAKAPGPGEEGLRWRAFYRAHVERVAPQIELLKKRFLWGEHLLPRLDAALVQLQALTADFATGGVASGVAAPPSAPAPASRSVRAAAPSAAVVGRGRGGGGQRGERRQQAAAAAAAAALPVTPASAALEAALEPPPAVVEEPPEGRQPELDQEAALASADVSESALAWEVLRQRWANVPDAPARVRLLERRGAALLTRGDAAVRSELLVRYFTDLRAAVQGVEGELKQEQRALNNLVRVVGQACAQFRDPKARYEGVVRSMQAYAAAFDQAVQEHLRTARQGRQLFGHFFRLARLGLYRLAAQGLLEASLERGEAALPVPEYEALPRLCAQRYQHICGALEAEIAPLRRAVTQYFVAAQEMMQQRREAAQTWRQQQQRLAAPGAGALAGTAPTAAASNRPRLVEVRHDLAQLQERMEEAMDAMAWEFASSRAVLQTVVRGGEEPV